MSKLIPSWIRTGLARCGRTFGDPVSVFVGAGLVSILLLLLLTARETRARMPQREPERPALVSVTRTNSPSLHRSYPRGQLQADLHTLVNMMRFVLTPELPGLAGAPAAAV